MAIEQYELRSRAKIRTADYVEEYFEVRRNNQRQQVVNESTMAGAAGYLKLRIGRDPNGTPDVSVSTHFASSAPASSNQSTRYDYVLVGPPVYDLPNETVTITIDVRDGGVSMGTARFQAMVDAGSPVGYGWRLSWNLAVG